MDHKKVVLITGGTKGIGFTTARKFVEQGYRVAINGRNERSGKEAVSQLKESGNDAIFLKADVGVAEEVHHMVDQVMAQYGRIDVLVNNAGGLGGRSAVENMSTDFWHHVLNVNLHSAFYCTQACIPYLKGNGGSIINLTSIAAYNGGGPGVAAYSVSKAGILAFTRATAKELIPYHIRVNAVSPGVIDTEFHSQTNKDLMEGWKQSIAAKRFGTADEVADVIAFLASDQASYIVGEVIQVNGGQDFR